MGLSCSPSTAADLVVHRAGDADATRRSDALESGGDVHDVAEDVVTVDDHVAVVDPDPELHRRLLRFAGRPPHHGFRERR